MTPWDVPTGSKSGKYRKLTAEYPKSWFEKGIPPFKPWPFLVCEIFGGDALGKKNPSAAVPKTAADFATNKVFHLKISQVVWRDRILFA